jgi:hypothetical protein
MESRGSGAVGEESEKASEEVPMPRAFNLAAKPGDVLRTDSGRGDM